MVDRALQRIANDHLAEVDLGTYQVTLPRPDGESVTTSLRLGIVATVEQRRGWAVRHEVEKIEPHLRHDLLLVLRQSRPEDLVDPDLTSLHERVAATASEHLTVPIESVAFRSFAVYED